MRKTEATTRDLWVDALKALSIVGVVWIHVTRGAGTLSIFMRFGVPVFVALWAYYFEAGLAKRSPEQHKGYVLDRLRKLVIPFCFWSILYAVYLQMIHVNPPLKLTSIAILKVFAGKGWPGQYFLLVLLQLLPVLLIIRSYVTQRNIWVLLASLFVLQTAIEFAIPGYPVIAEIGHRPFIYWLPYALIGIGRTRGYFDGIPKVIPWVIVLIAAVAAPFEARWVEANVPDFSPYIQATVFLMSAGIMLAWPVQSRPSSDTSHELRRNGVPQWLATLLSQIGSNTYPIFVLNPMVIYGLPEALRSDEMSTPKVVITTAIVIVICWLVGQLLRRLKLKVLIGE